MMKTAPGIEATAAYRAAMQRLEAASPGPQESGSSFAALLKSEIREATGALQTGEQVSLDALAGKASVQDVVEALSTAERKLQEITNIRDRVISAYQEIARMPI